MLALLSSILFLCAVSSLPPEYKYKKTGRKNPHCLGWKLIRPTSDHCCQSQLSLKQYNLHFYPFALPEDRAHQYLDSDTNIRPVQTIEATKTVYWAEFGIMRQYNGLSSAVLYCEDIRDEMFVENYPTAAAALLGSISSGDLRGKLRRITSSRRSPSITLICNTRETIVVVQRKSMRANHRGEWRDFAYCANLGTSVSERAPSTPLKLEEWTFENDPGLTSVMGNMPEPVATPDVEDFADFLEANLAFDDTDVDEGSASGSICEDVNFDEVFHAAGALISFPSFKDRSSGQ